MENNVTSVYIVFGDVLDFPKSYDKYIWSSERCIKGIQWCIDNKKEYEILPENWHSESELDTVNKYLWDVREKVLKYAVDILNCYHGTAYLAREWEIMLNGWIILYLVSLYDKYKKIMYLYEQEITGICDIYETEVCIPPLDTLDATELFYYSEEYHFFLFSQLIMALDKKSEIEIHLKKYERQKIKYQLYTKKKGNKEKLFDGYYKLKNALKIKDKVVIQNGGLPFRVLLSPILKGKGKITPYVYDYKNDVRSSLDYAIDRKSRKQFSRLVSASYDDFTKLACMLLTNNIPTVLWENYSIIVSVAEQKYKYAMNADNIITHAGELANNEIFKAYLMKVRRSGAKISSIQHGGGYGWGHPLILEGEYSICDRFYTWGWGRKESKFVPMPAVKGFMIEKCDARTETNILYVNYIYPKIVCRLDTGYLYMKKDLEDECVFLFHIYKKCKDDLIVRLFAADYGWSQKEKIQALSPDIVFDSNSNYYVSLTQAKLVIFEFESTTMLEALIMDKPFLVRIGWLTGGCSLEDGVLADFQMLKDVGIAYDSFDDLLQAFDEVYPNVQEWWNEPERREKVEWFREKYAYFPANAAKEWSDEIASLL